jgi:hypothetical protein
LDAQHKDPWRILHRLVVVVLTTLAIVGLWQGYGAWWFETVKSHGG